MTLQSPTTRMYVPTRASAASAAPTLTSDALAFAGFHSLDNWDSSLFPSRVGLHADGWGYCVYDFLRRRVAYGASAGVGYNECCFACDELWIKPSDCYDIFFICPAGDIYRCDAIGSITDDEPCTDATFSYYVAGRDKRMVDPVRHSAGMRRPRGLARPAVAKDKTNDNG